MTHTSTCLCGHTTKAHTVPDILAKDNAHRTTCEGWKGRPFGDTETEGDLVERCARAMQEDYAQAVGLNDYWRLWETCGDETRNLNRRNARAVLVEAGILNGGKDHAD